jgi:hypothetical protein
MKFHLGIEYKKKSDTATGWERCVMTDEVKFSLEKDQKSRKEKERKTIRK